ncbi:type II secretion system protein GspL [Endozoicomonas arenosclerae]|uniref:type II secretion system protein GspL n=1 Tax=Endozoicomonas arenosclerae TaxID=1633495 RepID=UPI0007866D53|nr:type II secretion system protein GspL [Endozoicomonas arenosclerae]
MKNILLIRIPPPVSRIASDSRVQWGAFAGNGQLSGDFHVSELGQIKNDWVRFVIQQSDNKELDETILEDEMPDQVVVLLPGTLVIHKQLPINGGQRKHLSSALPFMIEEELAEDIESMHLASYLHRKSDQVSVSAIPHEQMQSLLASLDEQGISAQQVMSELQFIQAVPQELNLLLENESVILSEPAKSSVCLDYDALKFVLDHWGEKATDDLMQTDAELPAEESTSLVNARMKFADGLAPLSTEQRDQVKHWLGESGWLVEEEPLTESVFEYLAGLYFASRRSADLVDLRHGPYQCPKRASRKLRRWKPLALVASVWLLLELGLKVGEGVFYHQKAQDYWKDTAALYLEVFPQDQQVLEAQSSAAGSINLKSRMESRLKSAGQKAGGEPFLPLLQQVSAVSSSLPELKLKPVSMDFNEASGKLVLELNADNLEGVDKLLAAVKSSGLSARLDSANQAKTGVNARMTIGR